jgi:hypothetical protein
MRLAKEEVCVLADMKDATTESHDGGGEEWRTGSKRRANKISCKGDGM